MTQLIVAFRNFAKALKMRKQKTNETVYMKRYNVKLRQKYCKTNTYMSYIKNMRQHERHEFSAQGSIRKRGRPAKTRHMIFSN